LDPRCIHSCGFNDDLDEILELLTGMAYDSETDVDAVAAPVADNALGRRKADAAPAAEDQKVLSKPNLMLTLLTSRLLMK
jgi:hypothetical protein